MERIMKCRECGSGKLLIGTREGQAAVWIGTLYGVKTTCHLCTNCGYVEEFISDPLELDRARRLYEREKPGE